MSRFVVIGGTSGIGEACANYIDSMIGIGQDVCCPTRDDLDVRDHYEVEEFIAKAKPTHLVYSAGFNCLEWIGEIDYRNAKEVFDVNVLGFIRVMNAMKMFCDPASVVAITSDAAYRPMRTSIAYCASKAALDMAVRVASRELAPEGWRINGVAPGKVADTPMTAYVDQAVLRNRGWSQEYADSYELQSTPIGRKVAKKEVAEVVWNILTGPGALTGEIVAVNGGR